MCAKINKLLCRMVVYSLADHLCRVCGLLKHQIWTSSDMRDSHVKINSSIWENAKLPLLHSHFIPNNGILKRSDATRPSALLMSYSTVLRPTDTYTQPVTAE